MDETFVLEKTNLYQQFFLGSGGFLCGQCLSAEFFVFCQ
jgi:hypothetical protein